MKLSKWDDYLIHQVVAPVETVGTDSPNFMDRIWFMAYSADGTLQLMAGLGTHPNRKIMDGFFLVRHKGVQKNIRVSRHIQDDKSYPKIGPLSFEVVVPQEHWRVSLTENDFGLTCDLDFKGRTAPYLFPKLDFTDQGQLHYKQPGYGTGHLTFEGEKFEMQAIPAVRDRSWGLRKPGIVSGLSVLIVIEAHFKSSAATLIYMDSAGHDFKMRQGGILTDDGKVIVIVQMQQKVIFEEGTQKFTEITMTLDSGDGHLRHLKATAIADPCYFSGGGYDGRHGLDCGPMHIEGETWDVSKTGNVETVFPYYSRVVEFDLDGEIGVGHVEAFFSQDKDWVYEPTLR